jgi:cytoskeleton protein RodZ
VTSERKDKTAETESQPVGSIGALLRATRQRLGQDMAHVSQALRIRQLYLQAIEEGRYGDLPGPTYAVGFVRTYADYLGLDSEEVVRRFRQEVSSLARPAELIFPTPVAEGRAPSGGLLMLALAVGAVIYGGWYAYNAMNRSAVEAVPEVPDRLAKVAEPPKAEAPKPEPVKPAEEVKALETAKSEPPKAEPPKSEPPKSEPPKPEPPKPAPGMGGMTGMSGMGGMGQGSAETGVAAVETSPPASNMSGAAQPGPSVSGAPITSPPAQPEAPRQPRVFGQTEGNVRIVLRATADAWIQVRDEKGTLVATRVLRQGDTYRVPSNQGKLSLSTGNAGGIEALVDGTVALKSLGPSGSVRRELALDPDSLRSGQ